MPCQVTGIREADGKKDLRKRHTNLLSETSFRFIPNPNSFYIFYRRNP